MSSTYKHGDSGEIPPQYNGRMQSLFNRVAIVTGASSGIGAATALEFAKYGSKLALTGRNRENLEKTSQQCQEAGLDKDKILIVTGDIESESDLENIAKTTAEHFGGINTVVNCGGITTRGGLLDTTVDQMDAMYKLHVRAPYLLSKFAAPHLIESKGSIINVSSISGARPTPGSMPYSVAKGAMDQFTKCIAIELAPKGVRVNVVNPGFVVTDIHRRMGFWKTEEEKNKFYDSVGASVHPLGRSAAPEEVSSVIAFLASDCASFITGVSLPIDGGAAQTIAGMAAWKEGQN